MIVRLCGGVLGLPSAWHTLVTFLWPFKLLNCVITDATLQTLGAQTVQAGAKNLTGQMNALRALMCLCSLS